MSIRLLNQVLDLRLRPAEKLVLSVLADLANDSGICWPSIRYVAPRASVSTRTLQRIMASLEAQELIRRQPRYRSDGSRTSSEYIILPAGKGDDKLSPPDVEKRAYPVLVVSGPSDTVGTPLPHREPLKENHHQIPDDLFYPSGFGESGISRAKTMLAGLSSEDSQILLDEVAGRMVSGQVKSPMSYLRALINRYSKGEFIPEVADQISQKRLAKKAATSIPIPINRPSQESVKKHLSEIRLAIAIKGAKSC